MKWLGIVTAVLSQITVFIPEGYGVWALIATGLASSLKDTIYKIGDQLDDGKQNESFNK